MLNASRAPVLLQEGRYVAGVQTQTNQNLPEYTVFPFADLQNVDDMNPVLGTCFANTTGLSVTPNMRQQVNDCAATHSLCCYSDGDEVTPGQLHATLLHATLQTQYKPTHRLLGQCVTRRAHFCRCSKFLHASCCSWICCSIIMSGSNSTSAYCKARACCSMRSCFPNGIWILVCM